MESKLYRYYDWLIKIQVEILLRNYINVTKQTLDNLDIQRKGAYIKVNSTIGTRGNKREVIDMMRRENIREEEGMGELKSRYIREVWERRRRERANKRWIRGRIRGVWGRRGEWGLLKDVRKMRKEWEYKGEQRGSKYLNGQWWLNWEKIGYLGMRTPVSAESWRQLWPKSVNMGWLTRFRRKRRILRNLGFDFRGEFHLSKDLDWLVKELWNVKVIWNTVYLTNPISSLPSFIRDWLPRFRGRFGLVQLLHFYIIHQTVNRSHWIKKRIGIWNRKDYINDPRIISLKMDLLMGYETFQNEKIWESWNRIIIGMKVNKRYVGSRGYWGTFKGEMGVGPMAAKYVLKIGRSNKSIGGLLKKEWRHVIQTKKGTLGVKMYY